VCVCIYIYIYIMSVFLYFFVYFILHSLGIEPMTLMLLYSSVLCVYMYM